MTVEEASSKYNIPVSVLKEYASWELCGEVRKVMGAWQYDDRDLERLSMIMTLHDIGFTNKEVETYMKLMLSDKPTEKQRMAMLNKIRSHALDEIHLREKQLERMDYLRHEINQTKR